MTYKQTSKIVLLRSILLLLVIIPPYSFADINIGNGFTCEGTSILKGTRTIPYSKAKSTIAKTLAKLRKKLHNAPKVQKAGIKEKIKQANNSKTQLKACSNGTLSPSEVDSIFTQLANGDGTFEGTYSGTVNGFIPLSGNIIFQFVLEQTTFSTLLKLGGNLGNTLDAKPLTFSADVGGIPFPAQFNLPQTFLGSVTLNISQDGHLTITNVDTKSTVNMDAQFSNQTITGTLSGSYQGIPFEGSFNLTRTS